MRHCRIILSGMERVILQGFLHVFLALLGDLVAFVLLEFVSHSFLTSRLSFRSYPSLQISAQSLGDPGISKDQRSELIAIHLAQMIWRR
jgi:hypothetical protein